MRAHCLRGDSRAAIDLPFKLLISVVLMAMAGGVLMPALQAYQEGEVERRAEMAMDRIVTLARSVYHNPGSSRSCVLDVPSAGAVHLETVSIGGDLRGPVEASSVIRWRTNSGPERTMAVTTGGRALPMAGPDGSALVMDGTPVRLVLESRDAPPGCWCDRYVQVRIA